MPAFEFEQNSLLTAGPFLHTIRKLFPATAYKIPQQRCRRFPGPGFSDAALQNAGKAYFSEGENREHFGIGLHIASALCKKHGGEISFANRIGQEGAIVSASFRLSSENLTHV